MVTIISSLYWSHSYQFHACNLATSCVYSFQIWNPSARWWRTHDKSCLWIISRQNRTNNNREPTGFLNIQPQRPFCSCIFNVMTLGSCKIRRIFLEIRQHHIVQPSQKITLNWMSTMMTSWNGNFFRVTGHLCGEFSGLRWIPRTKASDAELWCFLWSAPELTVE